MEIRPHRIIKRKITKKINVGNVSVGGDSPITVQSMDWTVIGESPPTLTLPTLIFLVIFLLIILCGLISI